MKKYFFLIALTCILAGCKTDAPKKQTDNTITPGVNLDAPTLPSMPVAMLQDLQSKATYADYIFKNLPFSVSLDEPAQVKNNIAMIGGKSPVRDITKCVALGREFFHIDGDIAWEADVYFDMESNCFGYVFYKDKKPVYVNGMTQGGFNFYRNLTQQKLPGQQ